MAAPTLPESATRALGAPRGRHPSTWLPFDYQRVPGPIRFWLSRWSSVGAGALVEPAVAFARDAVRACDAAAFPWPSPARAALGLSHDVDTARGLDPVERLLDLEDRLGVRSTIFLPGELAERHEARVRGWQSRGFEVGLHDVRHDNRLPDLDDPVLARRLDRIAAVASAFGMQGFRAPSFWIREATLARLPLPLAYDSSLPSLRGAPRASRTASAGGTGTCGPFRIGRVWELPVSLPVDDDLLRTGLGEAERLTTRARWVAAVIERGGVAIYVDHQEPHLSGRAEGRRTYESFLRMHLSNPELWVGTLREITGRLDGAHVRDERMAAAGLKTS